MCYMLEDSPDFNAMQNQAMRCFLGVHKFTAKRATEDDMRCYMGAMSYKAER